MLAVRYCLLFACFISGASATAQKEQEQVIGQMLNDYYETMSARNWPEYRNFFIDDGILVTIWNPQGNGNEVYNSTIDEFIALTPQGPDSQPIFEEKMHESEIEVTGGLATAWVKYSAKFGTEENLMEWEGTDLFTLILFEDEWKIVSLAYLSE